MVFSSAERLSWALPQRITLRPQGGLGKVDHRQNGGIYGATNEDWYFSAMASRHRCDFGWVGGIPRWILLSGPFWQLRALTTEKFMFAAQTVIMMFIDN